MRIIRNHEQSLWTKCKVFHFQECGPPSNQHIQRDDVSNPVSPRMRINMLQIALYFFIICTTVWYHLSRAHKHVRSWETEVRTGTGLLAGQPTNCGSIPAGDKRFIVSPKRPQQLLSRETSLTDPQYFPRPFFATHTSIRLEGHILKANLGSSGKTRNLSSTAEFQIILVLSKHTDLCLCNSLNK